jgi:hypothetical protein
MVESFDTALLEAQTTAVPKTVPFRYSLVLTPEIKAIIARKKTKRTMRHSIASSKMFVKNLAHFNQIINPYLILQNLLKTKVEASLHSKLMESPFSQNLKRLKL